MTRSRSIALSSAILSCLLAVQLSVPGPCLAQAAATAAVEFPKTPAGIKAGMFIAAVNSGDPEKLAAFSEAHYPSQVSNPQGRMIQDRTKGLDLVSIDQSAEHELVVSLKSRSSGNAVKMRVMVEPAPPHGVRSIGLQF